MAAHTSHKKTKIKVYTTFAEAAAADALESALMTPAECIREAVELTLRAYGVTREELNARKKSNRITITSGK
jgi:hypothetical protein